MATGACVIRFEDGGGYCHCGVNGPGQSQEACELNHGTFVEGATCCLSDCSAFNNNLYCFATPDARCPSQTPFAMLDDQQNLVVSCHASPGDCVGKLINCYFLACCCGTNCVQSYGTPCPAGCVGRATNEYCEPLGPIRCDGVGCCLCDRCCDMPSATCLAKGGTVMSGSCSQAATQTSCRTTNKKPACKGGKWTLGMRPTAHGAKPGVMSIVSERTHKTKDLPSGQNECRKVYGWLQRSATEGVMQGRICNQSNQRCTTATKKSPIMKLVRDANTGVMKWEGKYRTPCPEQSDMGCATTVGCAA